MTADWSRGALEAYLGADEKAWRAYDAVALIEDGHRLPELLVDQGMADSFLEDGLRPWLLQQACTALASPSSCACRRATTTPIISSPPSCRNTSPGTPPG